MFDSTVSYLTVAKSVGSKNWYTAREASTVLRGEVTEATIKEYCKRGELKAKKVGPKKRWMILGSSIDELRRKWKID
jgi:Helix-turn-helix domain